MPSKSFPFLDLPPEIREKIYIHVCTHPKPYIPLDRPSIQDSFPHALLLTNAQIYQEIRPIYFTQNAFSITIRRRNNGLYYCSSDAFVDNRRQIKNLRIRIIRWGSKNFFCTTIIPMLEDCILNGRLRFLEVVVRDVFLKTWEKTDSGAGTGQEYENWRMLRRVMRDPYLEKVLLLATNPGDESHDGDSEGMEYGHSQDVTWLLEVEGLGIKV